jgi:cytochrome o ubiquinol oxidase subunit 2
VRLVAACIVAVVLTGCTPGVLDPRGPIGLADRTILIDSLAIMLAIVVPTILATLGFAWWFRASNSRARYLPDWAFSGSIELVVWSIPLMVIILLGGVTWIGAHQLDPATPLASKAKPVEIQVVSLDWKWLFIYPESQVASVNELVVPAGVPLHFRLTSASVMNSFFVPQLGSMIYTMNGMTTELYLQADAQGRYQGISAHFSGDGFSDMRFEVRALPADAFAAWLDATRKSGNTLDAVAYSALAQQSSVRASTFGKVDGDIFSKIVKLELAPGPGPATARSGVAEAAETRH